MACRSQNWTSIVIMHHMLWETTVTVVNNTKERRKHTSKADTRVIQVRWLFSHVLKLKGWLVAVAERADNLSCIAIMTHLYQIAARAHHAIHPSFPFQQKKNPGVTCLKINYKLKKIKFYSDSLHELLFILFFNYFFLILLFDIKYFSI